MSTELTHIFNEDGECEACGQHKEVATQICVRAVVRTVSGGQISTEPEKAQKTRKPQCECCEPMVAFGGQKASELLGEPRAERTKDAQESAETATQRIENLMIELYGHGLGIANNARNTVQQLITLAIEEALQDAREASECSGTQPAATVTQTEAPSATTGELQKELEAQFVKRFGPMAISMGYGRDIQNYAAEQNEKLKVWKAAVKWANKRTASSVSDEPEQAEQWSILDHGAAGFSVMAGDKRVWTGLSHDEAMEIAAAHNAILSAPSDRTARQATERDTARLDWLDSHGYNDIGEKAWRVAHRTNLKATVREAIDAAIGKEAATDLEEKDAQ